MHCCTELINLRAQRFSILHHKCFTSVWNVSLFENGRTFLAARLDNFYAWVSNTQPTIGQYLQTTSCYLCKHYNGRVPLPCCGYVNCPLELPAARYVIIQADNSGEPMCLIEVEVYGKYVGCSLFHKKMLRSVVQACRFLFLACSGCIAPVCWYTTDRLYHLIKYRYQSPVTVAFDRTLEKRIPHIWKGKILGIIRWNVKSIFLHINRRHFCKRMYFLAYNSVSLS
jgi:hypothetical protein